MNNIKLQHLIIIGLISITPFYALGQTDSTLNKEVQVIKSYQPSISDAFKIGENPSIKDTNNYTPVFDYSIDSKTISIDKNINHLPVVKLGRRPQSSSNTGFLKGGFGNDLTPYGELIVNTAPSRKTDFGLQLYHFSSSPNIMLDNELKVKANHANSMGRVFMKNYFRKSVLDWEINYQRKGLTYYGFPGSDSLAYRTNESNSPYLNTRQSIQTAGLDLNLKNMDARSKLDYKVNVNYQYLWTGTNQLAHDAGLKTAFTANNRNTTIRIPIDVNYYYQEGIIKHFDKSETLRQFFKAGLSPQYIVKSRKNIDFEAGLNLGGMFGADSVNLWHISPKLYFAYHPIQGILTLFAGTDGGMHSNHYRAVSNRNKYVNPALDLRPSETVLEIYGGFKGKISRKVSYLTQVDYKIIQNQAFFYLFEDKSAALPYIANTFDVLYDDLNVLKFSGNIRFSGTYFKIELGGNYYLNETRTLTLAPHLPDFDASLNTSFSITDRLAFSINSDLIGPRETLFNTYDTGISGDRVIRQATRIELPLLIDVNLGAEYTYTNNLNFFISAQNLLNQNYQIWQGYNNQGLLILGGAKFIF